MITNSENQFTELIFQKWLVMGGVRGNFDTEVEIC